MPIKVKLETKTNKKAEDTIKHLKDGSVKIGWYKGTKYKNGLLVSEVAYMNDKGFTIKHKNGKETYVPPRPFMQITFTKNSDKWNNFWKEQYKDVADNRISLKKALDKLGIIVKSDIQTTIISSDGIRPNTESTLRSKKSKGHGTIPLIDSRVMLEHIDVESEVYG